MTSDLQMLHYREGRPARERALVAIDCARASREKLEMVLSAHASAGIDLFSRALFEGRERRGPSRVRRVQGVVSRSSPTLRVAGPGRADSAC
ncbi:hypothetical protein [Asaia sp. HN010]|uniref:hypothetical protein n=1 Tax=Asaia sp. HN010 TaxID=3081233 RepID=UPI0030174A8F